ncbi:hypothetical protein GQ600_13474 [Phytophthora cactorum]|nr:hypothetical protein GQ600_13470 [Phytophthora cactorum]KAF1775919.1 hypothetical protein GQ600_13474 [Phytophthora cactorum]
MLMSPLWPTELMPLWMEILPPVPLKELLPALTTTSPPFAFPLAPACMKTDPDPQADELPDLT